MSKRRLRHREDQRLAPARLDLPVAVRHVGLEVHRVALLERVLLPVMRQLQRPAKMYRRHHALLG